MPSRRSFKIALFVSLIVHTFVFFNLPGFNFFRQKARFKKSEIIYLKTPSSSRPIVPGYSRALPLQKVRQNKIQTFDSNKRVTRGLLNKKRSFLADEILKKHLWTLARKATTLNRDIITVRKKITLSPLPKKQNINKGSHSSYLGYYQIVREKVRRCAYRNYLRKEEGRVYLAFAIASNGTLRDVRIMPTSSSGSTYLDEVAIKSIKDACPFPPFPRELNYPYLTFNVIISFEIE
jgi:TonB family protein